MTPARGPWIDHFGDNFLWSNAALIIKGMAPYGAIAMEEVDRIARRLAARAGEADLDRAWREEWAAMADRVASVADKAAAPARSSRRVGVERCENGFSDDIATPLSSLMRVEPALPVRLRRLAALQHTSIDVYAYVGCRIKIPKTRALSG